MAKAILQSPSPTYFYKGNYGTCVMAPLCILPFFYWSERENLAAP